jgi:hypothetical protein
LTGAANPARKKAAWGSLVCGDCKAVVVKSGPMQSYCAECSRKRDAERKRKYQGGRGLQLYRQTRTEFGARGEMLNAATRLTRETSTPPMPEMAWYRRVEVPFSWAGSKNHIFASTSRGHVFMRSESRGMREHLTQEIARAVQGAPIVQDKLWLDIYVQKPTARGDAVNFVDLVCDAAKDALLLDDRWFSLRCVDWQIVKSEPKVFVGVGQTGTVDLQACSSCGRFLRFHEFQKNKARANGIGLNCRDCQATRSRSKKRELSALKARIELGDVFG